MIFSSDKFDVSLLSFTIPNANSSDEDSALFGVSLFFQQKPNVTSTQPDRVKTEFIHEEKIENTGAKTQDEKPASPGSEFTSPVSFDRKESSDQEVPANGIGKTDVVRQVKVSSAIPKYNERLQETPWTSRVKQEEYRDQSQPLSIGLALVSRRNVILSMRDTLSKLLFDYSRQPSEESGSSAHSISCATLVDVLGSFCHRDIENKSLQCILEPYLRAASAPWIDRPIANQEKAFESLSLRQFSDCLPPTPLALLFVTALLEQKIVLSSSRRSVLHSASVALSALLHPLKWSHLLVPLVPTSLAGDLIQYPAPFILGIPSDEAQHAELIGNLPKDVTLVDLDVGRVILAPAFGHDNEMVRRTDDWEATAKALRAQVLYLAQALGTVFGNSLRPETWCCDSPSLFKTSGDSSGIENLLSSAQSFINELLEGTKI